MIIDPVEAFKTSVRHVIPTAVPTDVSPIPSVLPDRPEYQFADETGKRTLWVVFVLMVISAAAFAAMSWRVPVVGSRLCAN
jgi:hypothetical protein